MARPREQATRLREAIMVCGRATDPLVVDLLTAMEPVAAAHEEFVATWADIDLLSGLTQDKLVTTDVLGLLRGVALVIKVVIDAAEPTA